MKFLKVRRMCGGGLWCIAYPLRGFSSLRLVRTESCGALIWDWPGVALAWKGDWR